MDQDVSMTGSEQDLSWVDPQLVEEASLPFVGRWNQLVSSTNWEKGRIIHQWREALRESGAPPTEFSDDAWSRRVGGVTGQHVGRLRRVYQRFGAAHAEYGELYWSHFQAAIEWTDAEMWLEGAVQNGWSVAQMRLQRGETLGTLDEQSAQESDVASSDLDEDFTGEVESPAARDASRTQGAGASEPRHEGPDFGEEEGAFDPSSKSAPASPAFEVDNDPAAVVDYVRPFAELTELPEDLAAAFEAFKLAILHHKLDDWRAISRDDVLASLEALKQLVVAP